METGVRAREGNGPETGLGQGAGLEPSPGPGAEAEAGLGADGMGNLLEYCKRTMKFKKQDPGEYSPLVLAYIGDAVYELLIRSKVVNAGNTQVNKLHKHSARLVCAPAQARMVKLLEGELREDEHAVFKRGRNAKSATTAKNASVIDYRYATGFEALVGWLFLTEQFGRLVDLVSMGLEKIGELEKET